MRAAIYHNQQDIRLEQVPIPEIREDEVLVEMKACGICGSDLMDWYLERRAPLVLGHEPAGIIMKVGGKVDGFMVGERVFVHHHVACLACHYCDHGDYTLCDKFHNTHIEPGGLAEYFMVPAPNLETDTLKIPEKLTYEESTFIEPIGCCLRALRKMNIQSSDTIAIIGAGTTGIIHSALSKILGAAKTIVSDLVDFRLQMAAKFGADLMVNAEYENLESVVNGETDGRGADLVVVTAPNLKAYRTGFNICRKGGKLCVFAPCSPGEYIRVNPKEFFFSEIQIIPSYSTSHLETRLALELLEKGEIDVKKLITHRFKLSEVSEAFETALNEKKSLKIMVLNG
jgi:L-iditol 2-dehydrogenase